ncbi:MAG TPA: hypothetical protein G4O03_01930 [Dehalococcoidia bacterium]|jgi:DNA polymerase (family 10)|nr:hypothetical protein [Dehalococcoidia bacterium]
MELKQAQALAQEIVDQLAPYYERIEVTGSIRRQRPFPRDIDIVLIPRSQGKLAMALEALGEARLGGKKLEERIYKGVQVDLYFATPETWATLLLIRTGSKAHNIKLTTLAKKRGWHLYASGRGLINDRGERIAGDSEESFFQALGLPYAEPWERER